MTTPSTLFFAITILTLFTPYAGGFILPQRRATACNGYAELCSRRYSNITFVGAHDSFAYSVDSFALGRDQEIDVASQLSLGVRLLQAQAHNKSGVLHFCHTDCLIFDGGEVSGYLKIVKSFLDTNPNEVLTLLFTNPEGLSVQDVWKPLFDTAGITPLAYVPPSIPLAQNSWPTLGEMIDSGKRVVIFMDANTNTSQVDFILPEFEMIWETPFSVTDPNFPCSIDRIHGPLSVQDHTYLINHSLNKDLFNNSEVIVSDPDDVETTNSISSIIDHVNRCTPLGDGRAPNFILLDFVDRGEAFKAVNRLNGLPEPLKPPTNSTVGANPPQGNNSPRGRPCTFNSIASIVIAMFLL